MLELFAIMLILTMKGMDKLLDRESKALSILFDIQDQKDEAIE